MTLLLLVGCAGPSDPARAAVERAIAVHGGDRFESVRIDFDFREHAFVLVRDGGRFHYERSASDAAGGVLREVMDNEGTRAWMDGSEIPLDPDRRRAVETAVNSVIYFGFLPFRLDDAAVQLRDLGTEELDGRRHRKVEVTFREEGGGTDWEDRFVYWFDEDGGTLEFLAYRFHTGEGGTRFRRAVNRREIGGIVIQDYENLTADPLIEDVAEYGDWYREGRLAHVSDVRLENVRISDP